MRPKATFGLLVLSVTVLTLVMVEQVFEATTAAIAREERYVDIAVEAALEDAYIFQSEESMNSMPHRRKRDFENFFSNARDAESNNIVTNSAAHERLQQSETVPLKNDRPRLILHVGPAKTATTTLQTDFTAFRRILLEDGFDYQGRFYNPFISPDGRRILNRTDSALVNIFRSLKFCEDKRECVVAMREELRHHEESRNSQRRKHVLLSDERFDRWTFADYQLFDEILSPDWRVEVVIVYRRFYDWLLSKKYQFERLDFNNPRKLRWPRGQSGPLPVVPDWAQKDSLASPAFVAQQVNKTFPLRVATLYAHHGVRSNVLCDILHASRSCVRSLELEQTGNITVMNEGKQYTDIRYYDAIAVGAKEIINSTSFSRSHVRKAVRHYHEETKSMTLQDLPMACPSKEELQKLLEKSLKMEKELKPDLYATALHDHTNGFQAKANASAFCWVDVDAVLAQKDWKHFFSRFV